MEHSKREHRRTRLIELLDALYGGVRGSRSEAAKRIGCELSYLSRILGNRTGTENRGMGEDFRVKIEEAFGLVHGWLDMPVGTPIIHTKPKGYEHDALAQPHAVSEDTPSYRVGAPLSASSFSTSIAGDWPFTEITPIEWAKLSDTQRYRAESCLRNILDCIAPPSSAFKPARQSTHA